LFYITTQYPVWQSERSFRDNSPHIKPQREMVSGHEEEKNWIFDGSRGLGEPNANDGWPL
jgi:hypothetical protein